MEFKYRAVDKKPTTTTATTTSFPHSSVSYASESSIPGGSSFSCLSMNTFQMPVVGDDVLLRELKKDQIRREIITGEIARRHELEAEVWRELALERSLEGIQMQRYLAAPQFLQQRVNPTAVDSIFGVSQPELEEPIESHLEIKPSSPHVDKDKVIVLARPKPAHELALERSLGGTPQGLIFGQRFLTAPPDSLQQRVNPTAVDDVIGFSEPGLKEAIESPLEIKPSSPHVDKDKVTVLARPKPDHELHSAKRKAVTPAVCDTEPSALGLTKKTRGKWSCALCQVNVTSEASFNKHLVGKKHKAKEESVTTQTIGLEATPNRESTEPNFEELNQTVVDGDVTESKNGEQAQLVEKSDNIGGLENPSETVTEEAGKTKASGRKKVWCEVCQIYTLSKVVMETHKKGKKHQMQMMKLSQN